MKFSHLTYANDHDPTWKRVLITTLERLAGRDYFVPLYERWRADFVGKTNDIMTPALQILNVELQVVSGALPERLEPGTPLVIVANHPFGIVDGFGILALAERLNRPYRILIHKDLVKVPEIRPYALPISFEDTKEAQAENIRVRREALDLLAKGTTIVVFPAGGVATAPTPFDRAVELPWKTFTARMILAARAHVLPVYFEGQCSPLFQLLSRIGLTLRLAFILREFRKRVGKPLKAHIGRLIDYQDMIDAAGTNRRALMAYLSGKVHEMSDMDMADIAERQARLPEYLRH